MNVLHCSATQVRPGRAAWGSRPQLVVVVEGATRVGRAKRNLLLAARTSTDNFFIVVPGYLASCILCMILASRMPLNHGISMCS